LRILLLSTTTGYQLRSFGESAERLGIDLVFGTDRCRNLDDPWRDGAVAVRFHDADASLNAIVEAHRQRPIDGVIAVGDRPVVLAARVAQALGLPGNPADAAWASANKKLARERFAAAGLLTPWFRELPLTLEVDDEMLADVSFPCVVKPIGLSGSRGVIRANSPEELSRAFARVRALLARKDVRVIRSGLEDRALVEGYIEGREFAIEGILTAGRLRVFAIFDKPEPLDGPFFEETIYVTPSAEPPEVQRSITSHIERAATALGLTCGPVHAECRIGPRGVFVLEVAARPIGGLCSKVLRFVREDRSAPAPLEEVLLRHACGEDVSTYAREPSAAGVMMIPIPKRGILKRVDGIENAEAVPLVEEVRITAKQDQLIEPLPEAASYLGFIFARGASRDDVIAALRRAHERLTFVIDPALAVAATNH
jgi:biotin carboxylase